MKPLVLWNHQRVASATCEEPLSRMTCTSSSPGILASSSPRGTVALSDHPLRLPPLHRSKTTDHGTVEWFDPFLASFHEGEPPLCWASPAHSGSMQQCPRRFFEHAIGTTKCIPAEVVTDKAAAYPAMLDELLPGAWHRTDRYANNHIETDHGRLKARLGPMRGLKQDRSATVIIAGHAFVQNLRRGHYELAVEEPVTRRVAVAFDELALGI